MFYRKKSEASESDPLLEWFKRADFYSSLIEMNKPIDPKNKFIVTICSVCFVNLILSGMEG